MRSSAKFRENLNL